MNFMVSRERVLKWGIKSRINSVNEMFQIILVIAFGILFTGFGRYIDQKLTPS